MKLTHVSIQIQPAHSCVHMGRAAVNTQNNGEGACDLCQLGHSLPFSGAVSGATLPLEARLRQGSRARPGQKRTRECLGQWNSGVGSHSLLQGSFPTQGSNPGLLHCRQILYCLSRPGSPSGSVKSPPAKAGDAGLIPGSGRSLGEENGSPLQSSCLENPMDREPGGLQSTGPQSRTRLSDQTTTRML